MPAFRPSRASISIGILVCTAVLALHAALLPEAHWQGDDFLCAGFARDFGWRYLWQARIDGWSPRPLSEPILYAYGRLAAAWRHPLAIPFLGLLWALLIASTLISLRRHQNAPVRVLLGLAVACMFLLAHPIGELFFWPAGAVAYLTTLAASTLAVFLLIDARTSTRGGAIALSVSLAVCAACSETGAIAAVALALVLAATLPPPRRIAILLTPTLLVAGFVLTILARHRMASAEAVAQHQPLLAHALRSLRPVPTTLLADLLPIWPAKLCLVLGLRWSGNLAPVAHRARALVGVAVALVLAACISIAVGRFQFGTACCERHDTLRQEWLVLALAALAIASTRWACGRPLASALGPAMLTLACLLGLAARLPAILADFRLMPAITATRQADWRSGRDLRTDAMIFRLPPAAHLAGPVELPTGSYRQPASDDWTAHGIMTFFGKRRITVLPAAR